jgi:hypothetical protein
MTLPLRQTLRKLQIGSSVNFPLIDKVSVDPDTNILTPLFVGETRARQLLIGVALISPPASVRNKGSGFIEELNRTNFAFGRFTDLEFFVVVG